MTGKTQTIPIQYFFPGPAYVRPEILAQMARPQIPHRSKEFCAIHLDICQILTDLFSQRGTWLVVTASSTYMMEACFHNTTPTRILALVNGAFAERWARIAHFFCNDVVELRAALGEVFSPAAISKILQEKKFSHILITHSETSTGALNPLAQLCQTIRQKSDALICVDAVSSLGGVAIDFTSIDFLFAGVQKAMALPPGITLTYLSDRYLEMAQAVPAKSFYFDLAMTLQKAKDGYTQTTPSAPHFFALQKQLHDMKEEGLANRLKRHLAMLQQTEAWVAGQELGYFTKHPAPTVSCLEFAKSQELVQDLRNQGFTIGGGYGELGARTFRIAHMGDVGVSDLNFLLDKMSQIIDDKYKF